jgi:WD40 repeat protein
MTHIRCPMVLVLGILVSTPCLAPAQESEGKQPTEKALAAKHTDARNGLPLGALQRLGQGVRFRFGAGLRNARITPDGQFALVHTSRRGVFLVDLATGKVLHEKQGIEPFAWRGMGISFDGKLLVSLGTKQGAKEQKIELWDIEKRQVRHVLVSTNYPSYFSFSPDSRLLALGEGRGKEPGLVSLWDVHTGKQVRSIEVPQNLSIESTFSPDSKVLVTGGNYHPSPRGKVHESARLIQFWDIKTGKKLREIQSEKTPERVEAVAFSPDGKHLAVRHWAAKLEIWDLATEKIVQLLDHHLSIREALRFSPDGQYLMGFTAARSVQLWETRTWQEKDLPGQSDVIHDLAFTKKGVIALVQAGSSLGARDLFEKPRWGAEQGHRFPVRALRFLSARAADEGGRVLFWDLPRGKPLQDWDFLGKIPQARDRRGVHFEGIVLSPEGKYVATYARSSGRIFVWNLHNGQKVVSLPGPPYSHGSGMAFSPDGKLAYVMLDIRKPNDPGAVHLWDVEADKEDRPLPLPPPDDPQMKRFGFSSLAFSPDGQTLAAAVQYNLRGEVGTEAFLWDWKTGKRTLSTLQKGSYTPTLAFSPDNTILAMGGSRQGIYLLHPLTGKDFHCQGIERSLDAVAFSPDGRAVAGTTYHPTDQTATIYVWERHTRKIRCTFHGHTGKIHALAFSPDSKTLASAGLDSIIYLWDATGNNQVARRAFTEEQQLQLWADLQQEDARKGFQAMSQLLAQPRDGLALLKKQLSPATNRPLTIDEIHKFIADLNDDRFKVREQATERLQGQGIAVVPELKKTLEKDVSLEVRVRIGRILHVIENRQRRPEELRFVRAVEVLERIADDEAVALLKTLAKGVKGNTLTEVARAALSRLGKMTR